MLGKLGHWLRVRQSLRHEKKKDRERSDRWPTVRDHYLREHGACEACTGREHLQVHHVKPFHLHPEMELDPANLLALCMGTYECHLRIGHGGRFTTFNPLVRVHVRSFLPSTSAELWKLAKSVRRAS